jgi:hypothetical protein
MKSATLTNILFLSCTVAVSLAPVSIARAQNGTIDRSPPTSSSPAPPSSNNNSQSPPGSGAPDKSAPPPSSSNTPSPAPQLPTVSAPEPPPIVTPDGTPANATPSSPAAPDANSVATASTVKVQCEGLSTVVRKGERQASLIDWKTSHFGSEYTPDKRCQIVSERLQSATETNGGTLKGLQLSSGNLKGQAVICILQNGENNCNQKNLLFTLKPENAKRSRVIINKILTFAKDGSTTIDESGKIGTKSDADLGSWERQAFPEIKKSVPPAKKPDGGF